MLSIVINILLAIHVLVSLLIIVSTLMQRPKSEGLGAAFGGGMTENLFGAQTTNVLANFTRWMGGIFFALTLLLSVLYAKQSRLASTPVERELLKAPPVPAAAASPSPGTIPVPAPSALEMPAPVAPPAPDAAAPSVPAPAASAEPSSAPSAAE